MCVINKPAKTAELAATTDIPKMTGKRMARTTCFRLEMRSFQENAINCTSPSAQCDDTCLPARSPMLSQRNRASLCSIPKAYSKRPRRISRSKASVRSCIPMADGRWPRGVACMDTVYRSLRVTSNEFDFIDCQRRSDRLCSCVSRRIKCSTYHNVNVCRLYG